MSWAASKSIDDLLKRLHANDPTLTSLHIFQGKRFEEKVLHGTLQDYLVAFIPAATVVTLAFTQWLMEYDYI